ncbi:mitochondrial protein Nca2 [Schizosaccharomyces osmophilus]|uniref:Mitochondrial protein Nca2 n=1 Tax=Schizosaccharomyces osmophilus TaxID=2545709 RepID=A0AAE9W702_9SCHI|nr:mitochondrial protein Nca2 [Schizosaccharomyces osmophilus]WBW70738.1 mitochondrial protein Nca2 [Schizosaccharomyces osmophilus]
MEIYRKHLKNVYSTFDESIYTKSSSPPNSLALQVFQQLDGSSISKYQLRLVIQEIQKLESNQHDSLYWSILGRCSATLHVMLLKKLLNETTELSDNMHYWETVDRNWISRLYYLIQSFPIRLWKAFRQSVNSTLRYPNFSQVFQKSNFFPKVSAADIHFYAREVFISRTNVLSLIRHEYGSNAKHLRVLRDKNASKIGSLSRAIMDARLPPEVFDSSVTQEPTKLDDLVSKWIERLLTLLNISPNKNRAEDLLAIFDTIIKPSEQQLQAKEYYSPSTFERSWFKVLTALLTSWVTIRFITKNQRNLLDWIEYLYLTLADFINNWVYKPVLGILDTISSNRADSQIAVIQTQSLDSDMKSLQRMVLDFVRDTSTSTIDLDLVKAQVREGDLTPVLQAYEHDLKAPLKTAISGNLIRTLLIQLQKTKVDVEVALSGIDRLLKSQQLVFATVGITPSIIFCYAMIKQFQKNVLKRSVLSLSERRQRFRQAMRDAERILLCSGKKKTLDDQKYGLLVFQVNSMAELSKELAISKPMQEDLLQDLEDIQTNAYGVSSQLRAIDRIYRLFHPSI